MPTLEHNAIVDMFRERPELAPHLLALLFHVDIPPHESVAVVESSLDQLIPIEFRADLVLEVRDAGGETILAIVVEVQRDEDPDKKFSWPVYAAVVRARMRCPTVVLVVTPDERVATWAAKPIDVGLGFGSLRPIVLGPASVPEITDRADATAEPELAILSAVAHGNGPNGPAVLEAALGGLRALDPEHEAVYITVISKGLREPMQRALEALIMDLHEMDEDARLNAFLKNYRAYRERLEAADPAEAAKMRAAASARAAWVLAVEDGKRLGLRDALLRLTARAGIALTDEDRARVEACDEAEILERWVENVLGAKTAADVFA